MNWNDIRQLWPIPEPRSSHALTSGVNNRTQLIQTASGRFVLRTYPPDRHLGHILYELAVLQSLQKKALSFRIPAPILTIAGEAYAISDGEVMTLTPWMPGSALQETNPDQTQAGGRALAELDQALAGIKLESASQGTPFPPSGEFESWAGGPLEPSRIIQVLPLEQTEQHQILSLMEAARADSPSLYRRLPQQIIHRDYDQSNVLAEGSSVAGVLDFEFCGMDLRILDLAYALSQWPWGLWNTGQEWPVIDAFCRGYRQRQAITQAEAASLPQVLRLRFTTGLFHRFARLLHGLEIHQSLVKRIRNVLDKDAWFQKNAENLISRALA